MTYYYVAIHDAGRTTLLAGPYETEEEAIAVKQEAWEWICRFDAWAFFYTVSLGKSDKEMPTRFGKLQRH